MIGGAERPGTVQIGPPAGPGQPPTQTVVSGGERNIAASAAVNKDQFVRLTTPVRNNITVRHDGVNGTQRGSEVIRNTTRYNPDCYFQECSRALALTRRGGIECARHDRVQKIVETRRAG